MDEADHIHAVAVRPLDLPVDTPTVTAAGTMRTAPVVLIDVRTSEGAVGRSYLRTYTPTALRSLAALVEDAAELVVGRTADPALTGARLRETFGLLGLQGLVGAAIAGIDMALWDAAARRRGQSLAELLGATATRVRAYAALRSGDPDDIAREAAAAVSRGLRAVKLKVGRGDLAADLEVVRRTRSAVGPGVAVMVDYNQSLTVEEALRRAPQLDEQGLEWVEEPIRADDLAGYARISARMSTPVQLGENWQGPHEMRRSVDAIGLQVVMLDAMRIGGVSGWLEASAIAAERALPVSSHAFPEFSAHLLAASPTRHWLEHVDYLAPILARPIVVSGGDAQVPDGPGAGLEWDERAIAALGR